MKAKKKITEIFFVPETSEDYDVDPKARRISKKEFEKLLKDSKKKPNVKKAS